jgi:hypothetical protein
MELNKRVQAAYNRIYELLKAEGPKHQPLPSCKRPTSRWPFPQFDQKKELATRLATIRKQATLLQEDTERLASWVGIAKQERNQSLSQVATRLAIVLAMIGLILLIAHYLKKLPDKFIKETRNLYYLRKIIGFCRAHDCGDYPTQLCRRFWQHFISH